MNGMEKIKEYTRSLYPHKAKFILSLFDDAKNDFETIAEFMMGIDDITDPGFVDYIIMTLIKDKRAHELSIFFDILQDSLCQEKIDEIIPDIQPYLLTILNTHDRDYNTKESQELLFAIISNKLKAKWTYEGLRTILKKAPLEIGKLILTIPYTLSHKYITTDVHTHHPIDLCMLEDVIIELNSDLPNYETYVSIYKALYK